MFRANFTHLQERKTEIFYSIKLFVFDVSKFCLNALGDQRKVLVKTLVFIQSLQLKKSKNCLAVD